MTPSLTPVPDGATNQESSNKRIEQNARRSAVNPQVNGVRSRAVR